MVDLEINMDFPTVPISRLALCEANCKKPVYTMHKWWARRLGVVFRMLLVAEGNRKKLSRANRWEQFYSPTQLPEGFTVLDPFLGGGTSLVEAAKLGAHCIGIDIDPVACFVSEQELSCIDPNDIATAFQHIKNKVEPEINALYKTRIGSKNADVIYSFWVDSITCPSCESIHDGHPLFQLAHSKQTNRQSVICRHCSAIQDTHLSYASWSCRECGERTRASEVPVSMGIFSCPACSCRHKLYDLYTAKRVRPRLFAQEYLATDGSRGFAKASVRDLDLIDLAKRKLRSSLSLPIPNGVIPSAGRFDKRPLIFGYRRYSELFNELTFRCPIATIAIL